MADIMQTVRDLAVAKAQVILAEYRNEHPDKKNSFEETETFVKAYYSAFADLNANLLKIKPE
ncbi:MAG: hypothetical protein IJF87_08525 [Erysipelotrichaceae bacterium]|nr:hypothetical protein [Erysipelotrichaceae bacterium]